MTQKDKLLKADQANKLVYSSYEMTLNEKRLLMLSICKLSMDMSAFPLMYVKISDLKEYLEIEGTSLNSSLRNTCRKLLRRLVEIENENGDWIAHQWVSRCKITKGSGILEIKLHNDLKPYLLRISELYQSIPFEHIAKIHKSHAIRLFEILWHKRMEKGHPINEIKIELEDLHKMLALSKSYEVFSFFKKRILDPAQKELEKNTPIRFTYEIERIARTPVSITFTVFENDDYKAEKLPPLTAQMMLELKEEKKPKERSRIIWSHIGKHFNHESWGKEYKDLIESGRTFEEIEKSAKWATEEIDRKSKTDKPVKNPAAYVIWAIRNKK